MSSIATDEDIVDRWIEIDDSISVPEQTLDEILADKILDLDDEFLSGLDEEESLIVSSHQTASTALLHSYKLDSPLHVTKLGSPISESISYQLKAQCDHNIGGHAKALAVSNNNIAVGTSRGLVLIFSRETQKLVHSVTADGFPVSCLDFNQTGTLLAMGYSSGSLRIFDVAVGKVIDDVSDLAQSGQGLLQILFSASGRKLACLDSGGSVYELRLSGAVLSRRIHCVFSGCHGEVVYLKMLDNGRILALLSLKKLFLVSIKEMRLLYSIILNGPTNLPPLIDAQAVTVKGNSAVKTAAFFLARGSKIEFYYIHGSSPNLKVIRYRVLSLDYDLINLKWVEQYYLIAIDASERVHVIDPVQSDIAMEDICDVHLSYGTADFKGLSTGGNVSAALAYLAYSVCYQSMYHIKNDTFILGETSVYLISVSDQVAQLEALIDRGEVVSAVLFALDLFSGKIVSKSKQGYLKHVVSSRIPGLINSLLAFTTSGVENGKVVQLVDHYKKHIQLLIRACIITGQLELLYNTVYDCLEKDALSKAIFFENIDEVSDYFRYLVTEGNLNQFEAAVVRIPVEKQDIHFVMTNCKKYELYDGVIYVYNKAISDYIGPLEEMLDNVATFVNYEVISDCNIAVGNKLLLYIQCCLSGIAYPIGSLPEEVAKTLPLQVYRCLISYKGKNGTSCSITYPYLRVLIRFDAVQFFNVILTCSDCNIFKSEEGRLQRIVEVIYKIIDSMDRNAVLFVNYFTLVAYLLQKKTIIPSLEIINELIEMVLSFGESVQRIAEAERCIVEVMRIVSGLDEEKILRQARKLPHLQVCSYIYTSRRDFINLVECYLSDPVNAMLIFPVIRTLILELQGNDLSEFRLFLQNSLVRFNKIDCFQTAELVLDHFMEWLSQETLENSDEILLYYFCFMARRERGYRTLTGSDERDEQLLALAVKGVVLHHSFDDLDVQLCEFLRYWLKISSRTDRCLNYAVKSKLILSSVLLLEARRLVGRAFELLNSELETLWGKDLELSSKYVYETIRLACIYHEEVQKGNWLFKILDRILSLSETEFHEGSCIMEMLNSVIAAVMASGSSDAERLVDALFAHPAFRYATYAKFRSLITSMFALCQYEEVLLKETVQCIEEETIQMLNDLKLQSTRRYASLISSNICVSCRNSGNKSSYLYKCRHMVHIECASHNDVRYCLCQENAFSYQNVEDNLKRASSRMLRKTEKVDLFSEDSLKLMLGPSRLEYYNSSL
ncbi:unnamed protein product [Thelazia callipaeda]|uniref:Vps8 domain-containing protein n=1 Tax=Thelazia callipaeda TaxID=103827 RepID=A0A0N5CYD8_THECL|nr:unnamed protein product [Thelazia callipaeda]